MTYLDLRKQINQNLFEILDVVKLFPSERPEAVRTQLYRLSRKGLISPIKRGLYSFDKGKIDELELAGRLYSPSYVSLETALNYHGVIPDVPIAVRSATPVTTKKIETKLGSFYYLKINSKLFFGFSESPFAIAYKEKALLDYFYLRHIKKITPEMRLDLSGWDFARYHEYALAFPKWVQKIELP